VIDAILHDSTTPPQEHFPALAIRNWDLVAACTSPPCISIQRNPFEGTCGFNFSRRFFPLVLDPQHPRKIMRAREAMYLPSYICLPISNSTIISSVPLGLGSMRESPAQDSPPTTTIGSGHPSTSQMQLTSPFPVHLPCYPTDGVAPSAVGSSSLRCTPPPDPSLISLVRLLPPPTEMKS